MHAHRLDNMRVRESSDAGVELTFCVVNTSQRELLRAASTRSRASAARCRSRARCSFSTTARATARRDGARAFRGRRGDRAAARVGKAFSDSELLRRARGRYALLLNEDSELQPGATLALHRALEAVPSAACAGARLLRPDGTAQACAWRFPTPLSALATALCLQRLLVVQSRGTRTREVDWCQSSALLVRRDGGRRGRLPRRGFLRLLRRGRLRAAPARRGLAQPLRAGGGGGPRRAALDRRGSGARGSSNSRATAISTCASTTPRRRARGALADRLGLRACARCRASCCRATPRAATGATCARRFSPSADRDCARRAEEYNRAGERLANR